MYTAMAVVALTMGMTSGSLSPTPTWLNDYQKAQASVAAAGKPMVVFVGAGKTGYQEAVREGAFDPAITKLLSSKFVCLYVDTTTPSGRSLADALQIKKVGVVISDKSGTSQAFSASAALSRADLESALVKYADPKEVKGTETVVPAGGPVPPGAVVPVGHGVAGPAGPGGCGYGYGYGGGCCGKGYGYGGGWGCCGKGWGGGCCGWGRGCCGKGYGYGPGPVAVPPVAPAPPAKAPAGGLAPAPAPVAAAPVAGPSYGYGGGCCGWGGGCCGKGYGYGGGWGCCGKGWGGGWGGGCCGWGGGYGYGYGYGGCCK